MSVVHFNFLFHLCVVRAHIERDFVPQHLSIMKEIKVFSATKGTSRKTGKPLVVINNGEVFLPYGQVITQGVYDPAVLQGTTLLVEYYMKGEALVSKNPDGTPVIVDRDNTIVKQFVLEQDKETARQVNTQMRISEVQDWVAAARQNSQRNRALSGALDSNPQNAAASIGERNADGQSPNASNTETKAGAQGGNPEVDEAAAASTAGATSSQVEDLTKVGLGA